MKTKIQLIGFFAVMAMCLTANRAVAQNYSLTHSSGTETITLTTTNDHKFQVNGTGPEYDTLEAVTVTGGTLNLIFDNAESIYVKEAITVTKGTLNISVGDNCSGVNSTIIRAQRYTGRLVYVNASENDPASCRLNIQGETDSALRLAGAISAALSEEARAELLRIQKFVQVIDLPTHPSFNDAFTDAMFFE